MSNWTNNMAPIDGKSLIFTNNYNTTSITNDLVSGTTPSGMKLGLNFTANAPAYTIYGNPVMMDYTGGVDNKSANLQTLNAPLFLQFNVVVASLNCGTAGTVFNSLATPDTNTTTAFNLAGGNATVVNNQMIGGMQFGGATLTIGSIANAGVNPSVSVTNVAGANTITFATGTAMDGLKVGQVVSLQPTSVSSVLPLPIGTVVTGLATNGSIITATLSANSVAGFTNNVGVWFGNVNALGISSSAANNLWFNGLNATLQYTGPSASTDRGFQVAAAYTSHISVTNPTTVLTMSGNSYTVGGAGNVAAFAKDGTGTLVLTGTHTNTGAPTVSAGTLLVNRPGSLGVTAVTVQNNATFGGTGTAGGAVTFSSGALGSFTVTPTGSGDNNSTLMTITGVMAFNSTVVHLSIPSNLGAGTYTLASSSATPTGTPNSVPVVDNGSFASGNQGLISVDTVNKKLLLTVSTAPTKLAFSSIPASGIAGTAFSVTVQSQDAGGTPQNVNAASPFPRRCIPRVIPSR
ncbi:MAG: autotransporter-associated beta strand repeat-containing protein [Verrucomicrobia bacterium]|nr:autotransporter-associated beta strand repeat-containing protein [Verrucomicrobiota bacterium]